MQLSEHGLEKEKMESDLSEIMLTNQAMMTQDRYFKDDNAKQHHKADHT